MPTFAGCRLEPPTFRRWQGHFAPPAQPFFVSESLAERLPAWPRLTREAFSRSCVSLSLHDTFATYNVAKEAVWVVWLTQAAFSSLPRPVQADLLTEQRDLGRGAVFSRRDLEGVLEPAALSALETADLFVWWPKLWAHLTESETVQVLRTFVETDRLPCRRHDLTPDNWRHIATHLPGASRLAGTFLPESGGNCLGTVMAAFGVPAAAESWVQPEPFERWLAAFSPVPEGDLEPALGDVLVWRSDGRVQHAAVSLGGGFVLHKEAQGWFAPRQVVRLADALGRWREDGDLYVYARRA